MNGIDDKLLETFVGLSSIDSIKKQSEAVFSHRSKLNNFWILGAGSNGRKVLNLLERNVKNVVGFIDDTPSKSGLKIDGIEIFNFNDFKDKVSSDDNIVISILNGKSSFTENCGRFDSIIANRVISAHEIFCIYGEEFYFIESLSNVEKDVGKYRELFETLSDTASKTALINYLHLKIYFKFYTEAHDYFEPLKFILKNQSKIAFLDGGAFDGDTVIAFHKLFKDKINKIVAFEPDFANYNLLLKNLLENDINSLCLNAALSNETKILKFNADGNTGSALNTQGNTLIQAISVDSLSFSLPEDTKLVIKMDIEGHEADGIDGMKKTIKAAKPVLAVSVYHKPADLLEIVDKVLEIDSSYQLYLRFHAYDGADLTAYFI